MRIRKRNGESKDTCSCCGKSLEEKRKWKQRYCLKCHAKYMRENRVKHSELPDEQRKRANARSYLHVYIKRGKIVKGKCAICDNQGIEAHHEDYNKPLDVVWLCREHHIEYHLWLKELKKKTIIKSIEKAKQAA